MMEKSFKPFGVLLILSFLFCFFISPAISAGIPIWTDGFEGNWQDCWHVDAGTWEVGPPTSGPAMAFNGTNSAATILAGNYGNYVDSRLVRHCAFVVPPAAQNPVLRFWHWYYFYINDSDYGQVQIRAVGDTDWTTLAEYRNHSGGIWTQPFIPLSDYAGQTVEIAFNFHSDGSYAELGWYIDDVSLEVGYRIFTSLEDWESGLDDWHIDYGTWNIGSPTSGPGSALGGENCVATGLDGNYSSYVDSRLISPPFVICPAVENPVFRFWHWYYFYINDNDYGQVQIRAVGDTDWTTLAEYGNHGGGIWTQPYIPLSDYTGQTVQIAFHFHSDNSYPERGWYIDDIELQGLTPLIGYAPLAKYSPPPCSALIPTKVYDPCGEDLFYNWNVPEGCDLIGTGPEVEVVCPVVDLYPYQVSLSVESEKSYIGSQKKIISIFTQVENDTDGDADIDGDDLYVFANIFVPDDLARFAMEFGLIACQ